MDITPKTKPQNAGKPNVGQANPTPKDHDIAPSENLASVLETGFGWVQASDRASKFVALVDEAAKTNEMLKRFPVVRIDSLCSQHGSAVAVVLYYKETDFHVVNVIYFENNESLLLSVDDKQKEQYISTVGLIDESFSAAIKKEVAEAGYHNPMYLSANIVPADVIVDTFDKANNIMRQLIASTLGRKAGLLDKLVLESKQVFSVNVNTFTEDSVLDPNGLPQRADFGLRVINTVKGSDSNTPVLTNNSAVRPDESISVAYAGLRYVGYRQQNVVAGQVPDLQQIAGEVNVTLTNTGGRAPMERQMFILAMWGKIAAQGAWRGPLLDSLSSKRKLSAVARHLYWGQDTSKIDMSAFDKDRTAQNMFLDKFCKPSAALVLTHRIGNGLGGLSGLFADMLSKSTQTGALSDLVKLLDSMMPAVYSGEQLVRAKFTDILKANLNTSALQANHFVAAMVPTVSGSFKGSSGPRSLDELDLVTVCNYFGDKFKEVKTYVELSSFSARRVDAKEARIALMKFCDEIYGSNSPRYSGEAIQMVLAPTFVSTLISEVSSRCTYSLNGASNYVKEETSLFADNSGVDFTIGNFNNNGNVFGDTGQTSINGTSSGLWGI